MPADSSILYEESTTDVEEPEVLVVGAGPVGLFAALLLAAEGIDVQVLEEERRPAARSYALALHPRSLALLDQVELAPVVLERAHRLGSFTFWEGDEPRARLDLGALPARFPFVTVLPQQSLEGILESRLDELGVPVLWNHRLADLRFGSGETLAVVERLSRGAADGGTVEARTVIRPRFVLGADGHRSTVRRALALESPEVGPAELFAVFEVITAAEGGPEAEARVVLDQMASVLWPICPGRFRWSFQVESWDGFVEPRFKSRRFAAVAEEPFPYLVRERLGELLAERAPWFELEVAEIVWSMAVHFERRLAGRFGRGPVWLAGDAAHLASPVGAQSLNVGLVEAHGLAERLIRILRHDAPLELLEQHGRDRHAEWRRLLGLKGAPTPTAAATPWVRRHAARLLPCIPASGEDLDALLAQLGLELRAG